MDTEVHSPSSPIFLYEPKGFIGRDLSQLALATEGSFLKAVTVHGGNELLVQESL